MNVSTVNIAIDGPSGAGKSTIARIMAKRLGYLYVDTGALYRALGLALLEQGVDIRDPEAVAARLPSLKVSLTHGETGQRVLVGERDVTDLIRTPEISMAASAVSAQPAVRAFLLRLQQDLAERHDVIMDGRDIGTVVLPRAQIKIVLFASAEDRADRRYAELLEKGQSVTYQEVLADMKKRDWDDAHREIAPLRPAEDAVLVDTTGYELPRSVERLYTLIKEKLEG